MRVNRRFLYWGIVLASVGGVLVAADLGTLDTARLTETARLWPLAVIAIGLSLVLRRTRMSLPSLLLAAALPGLVLGAGFAAVPRFIGDCGARGESAPVATTQGTLEAPATVSIRSACGSLHVSTAPGNGWQLRAANTSARTPVVDASAGSLSIDGTSDDFTFFDAGRDTWDLTLPTSALDDLSLVAFAGRAQVDLPGAHVKRLELTVNAAQVVIDASAASVDEVSAKVNVGMLSIRLPAASDLVGSLRVGAGELQICAPPGLGLHVVSSGTAERIAVNGLQQRASEWESPNYASANNHADLQVTATFGAVEIDPIGGCK
jgi:hypothetical protein